MASLSELGFNFVKGYDGKDYALVYNRPSDRAWGAYLKDKYPLRLQIQVPHIKADNSTEIIGLELWRRIQGSLLLISGTHRTDSTHTNPRDVAWMTGSMFHKVAGNYLVPQLQIHGFANASQPDFDFVVSTGSAPTNDFAEAIASALENDFRVARYWLGDSNIYGAVGNKQSINARDVGLPFTHIEMNNTVRTTPVLRNVLIEHISTAVLSVI